MTLRERFQRLVSRKSLYSSSSSSASSQDSSSSASSTNESRAALSSGATTPLPVPISTSTPHPLAPILNPSGASPSSSSQPSPTSDSAPKTSPSLMSKTMTWRSSHGHTSSSWSWGGKERRERKKVAMENKAHGAVAGAGGKAELPKRRIHPSERPLTEANLRQQEALAQFKWEFGRKGPGSLGGWSLESGISPCGSRRSSYDLTVHKMPLPPAASSS